eukprot:Rhum_TRINITY_DN23667_c0_g1::Rhum_TRINITY_DN23667_c0_g1_i1::g.178515::m.178515
MSSDLYATGGNGGAKRELDFTDPHLIGTLASLAVSVPLFFYFLWQMIANRDDWDTVFDDDGNACSERKLLESRLERLRARKGKRGGANDVAAIASAADAYSTFDAARRRSSAPRPQLAAGAAPSLSDDSGSDSDENSSFGGTPPGSPPAEAIETAFAARGGRPAPLPAAAELKKPKAEEEGGGASSAKLEKTKAKKSTGAVESNNDASDKPAAAPAEEAGGTLRRRRTKAKKREE